MRAVLRWVAIGAGLVMMATAALGMAAYRKFSGNIRTDQATERVLAAAERAGERPRALVPQARNILVLGATAGRRKPDGSRADAAVLLHLSADRGRAAAVGVPGGLMVSAPSCPRPDGGGASPAAYEPFGAAFAHGGAACSIRAFERLSGIRVDHHLVVDDVPGFAGSRRDLLRTLAQEARGGSLTHPARLYGVLDTATSSITADPGLSSLPALYELAGRLREVPADRLVVTDLPVAPEPGAPGAASPAGRLLAALRADRPLAAGARTRPDDQPKR